MTSTEPNKKLVAGLRRELCSNVFAHPWGVMLQVFVPGCSPDEVQVHFNEGLLRVSATPSPTPHAVGLQLVGERSHEEGERQFTLGDELDFPRMTQALHHGVLTIIIPQRGVDLPHFSAN